MTKRLISRLAKLTRVRFAPVAAAASACCVLAVSATQAAEPFPSDRLYGEIGLGAGGVKVGELDYYPVFATLAGGVFVLPGIGIELFADAGVREGTDADFQLEIEHGFGAAVRLESPPIDGLSGYMVLGYANFRLRQDVDNDHGQTRDLVEDFGGPRVSIGLVQRFTRVPALSLAAEYRKYYVEDGIDLDALVLSLRVSAP